MRVCILATPTYNEIGGVSTHTYMLKNGLEQQGQEVIIIDDNINKIYEKVFIKIIRMVIYKISKNRVFHHKYYLIMFNFWFFMKTLISTRMRIDILNIQGVKYYYAAKWLKKFTDCKVVITVHGYLTYEYLQYNMFKENDELYNFYYDFEMNTYKNVDKIVAVGSKVVDYVKENVDKEVSLIHNGIDLEIFKSNKITKDSDKIILLFTAVFKKHKGLMDSIFATEILHNKGYDCELRIAGYGEEEELAKDYVKQNNIDYIKFLGKLSKEDMPKFYNSGDILLVPSKKITGSKGEEPFGYTALEGMSCAIPVIAYNSGGLVEQIINCETGYLIEQGDYDSIAIKCEELINNKSIYKKMSANARDHVMKNYSSEIMAKKFITVFNEI